MLSVTRQGATYHFRRAVPARLRTLVGQAEFWASLGTSCRTTASARAGVLYAAVERVLILADEISRIPIRPESELELLRKDVVKTAVELADVVSRKADLQIQLAELKSLLSEARHLTEMVDGLKKLGVATSELISDSARLSGQVAEARRHGEMAQKMAADMAAAAAAMGGRQTPAAPSGPLFSSLTADHLNAKSDYSEQTRHQSRATFRLWVELMGDGQVDGYTGRDAGRFQEQLRKLPASHGKAVKSLVQLTAQQGIERADASPVPVPRLSEKTIKRHVSALSQYWIQLRRWEHVQRNIFEGMEFPGTGQRRSTREDWSPEDIGKLLTAQWRSRSVTSDTYRWLTAIAAYSGMRLEEICRLRPVDVVQVGSEPFIVVQEQPDGWSPKSEAGARAVPVHPRLVEIGFLDMVESRRADGAPRLLKGLRPGGTNKTLGWEFSREFGKHKVSAGIGSKTVFHSWRHSVSTLLRNADAGIRSEWIDAVLGHEGGEKSMGATTYLKRIGPENLTRTMSALRYEPEADPANLLINPILAVLRSI